MGTPHSSWNNLETYIIYLISCKNKNCYKVNSFNIPLESHPGSGHLSILSDKYFRLSSATTLAALLSFWSSSNPSMPDDFNSMPFTFFLPLLPLKDDLPPLDLAIPWVELLSSPLGAITSSFNVIFLNLAGLLVKLSSFPNPNQIKSKPNNVQ